MGPKHKGFPMTQSIHFWLKREKQKVLNLLGLILQAEAQKLYIYKNGWGLHLKGCPWFKFDLGFWKIFWKETLIL